MDRPRFRELSKAGKLDQALRDAAERTYRELSSLEESGYQEFEAWEIVRERYLFPPQNPGLEEDDEPDPWADLRTEAIQLWNDFLKLVHEPDNED